MNNKWNKLRRQNLGTIPQEASINLNAPETAPLRKTDKVNIRTKPLNFKVSEEFYWRIKDLALKEKCLMVEILEKSLGSYERERKTSPNYSVNLTQNFPNQEAIKTKPTINQQLPKNLAPFSAKMRKHKP